MTASSASGWVSSSWASWIAANAAIPEDPPTSRPSSRASRRVIENESASETSMIRSAMLRS